MNKTVIIEEETINRLNVLKERENEVSTIDFEGIISSVIYKNAKIIIEIAFEKWTDDSHDGIVFLNLDNGKLEGKHWTPSIYKSPDYNAVELYRLKANWIDLNDWGIPDELITDKENESLINKFGDDTVCYKKNQLEIFGIDFDKSIKELLVEALRK
jgi:hypothetical protein